MCRYHYVKGVKQHTVNYLKVIDATSLSKPGAYTTLNAALSQISMCYASGGSCSLEPLACSRAEEQPQRSAHLFRTAHQRVFHFQT